MNLPKHATPVKVIGRIIARVKKSDAIVASEFKRSNGKTITIREAKKRNLKMFRTSVALGVYSGKFLEETESYKAEFQQLIKHILGEEHLKYSKNQLEKARQKCLVPLVHQLLDQNLEGADIDEGYLKYGKHKWAIIMAKKYSHKIRIEPISK